MQRERVRLLSRRGGSGGGGVLQGSSYTPEPERLCPPATRSCRGRGSGRSGAAVCEHTAHHTGQYHFPCSWIMLLLLFPSLLKSLKATLIWERPKLKHLLNIEL